MNAHAELCIRALEAMRQTIPAPEVAGHHMVASRQGQIDAAIPWVREVERYIAALRLIARVVKRQGQGHLGSPRFSGIEQGCIHCICTLTLDNKHPDAPTAAELDAAIKEQT